MVSGDHHDGHACFARTPDGVLCAVAQRIRKRQETRQLQAQLIRILRQVNRNRLDECDSEDPNATSRISLNGSQQRVLLVRREPAHVGDRFRRAFGSGVPALR